MDDDITRSQAFAGHLSAGRYYAGCAGGGGGVGPPAPLANQPTTRKGSLMGRRLEDITPTGRFDASSAPAPDYEAAWLALWNYVGRDRMLMRDIVRRRLNLRNRHGNGWDSGIRTVRDLMLQLDPPWGIRLAGAEVRTDWELEGGVWYEPFPETVWQVTPLEDIDPETLPNVKSVRPRSHYEAWLGLWNYVGVCRYSAADMVEMNQMPTRNCAGGGWFDSILKIRQLMLALDPKGDS